MGLPDTKIITSYLQDKIFDEMKVSLSVLRLDEIHPVISGNKLYKLHYFLQTAARQSLPGIVTFGGAYSNHLVATAFACRQAGLKSAGIVRGEEPALLSHTLLACRDYGMDLKFISRQDYAIKEQLFFQDAVKQEYTNYLIVPEGGYHPLGAAGAALIMDLIADGTTHICSAVGTATTLSGLLLGLKNNQQIMAFPVLKNMHDLEQRIQYLTCRTYQPAQLALFNDYHFGGYAKKTKQLVYFMNQLYLNCQLPTDFIYTGKMMFGIFDCIKKGYFKPGSKIVCIHTGGLQGNFSLPPGTLIF